MCRVLQVTRSGYYQWIHRPKSARQLEDERLLDLVRASHTASGGVYGCNRVSLDDLREAGERCGRNRIASLMRKNKLQGSTGVRRPKAKFAKPSHLAPNRLKRQFTMTERDKGWVTDITYIRTWEGWLYLAVVIDLLLAASHWMVDETHT